jgi:prephenate dehydrogenase
VWGDILETNRDALTGPLAALIAELEGARDALEAGDSVALEDLFRRAGRFGGR